MYGIQKVRDLDNQSILFAVIRGLYTSALSDGHLEPYESVFGWGDSQLAIEDTIRKASKCVMILSGNHYIKDKDEFYEKVYQVFMNCCYNKISSKEFAKLFISIMEQDFCALSNDNWDNYIVPLFLTYMVSFAAKEFKEDIFNQLLARGLIEDNSGKELDADNICFEEEVWGKNCNQSWRDAYNDFFLDEFFIYNPEADPFFLDATLYRPQTI